MIERPGHLVGVTSIRQRGPAGTELSLLSYGYDLRLLANEFLILFEHVPGT